MDKIKTGALIAAARKEKDMTQKELAAALHVSDRAISKWERGAGFPDISLLEPLADALDLGVLDLLRGERGTEPEPEPTVRQALAFLARQAKERTRKRWSQVLAGAVLLALGIAILLAILATAGVFTRIFARQITAEVPATVYSQEGEAVGEATVSIDGTQNLVWSGSYEGRFAISCVEETEDMTAYIQWDVFGRNEGGEFLRFSDSYYYGVEHWLYITEDMGSFGLRLEDGTIIATDESYVPLLTADYYYAVYLPVETTPWSIPME
mgnify:CR=1 FL=1